MWGGELQAGGCLSRHKGADCVGLRGWARTGSGPGDQAWGVAAPQEGVRGKGKRETRGARVPPRSSMEPDGGDFWMFFDRQRPPWQPSESFQL